jgi:hypothetical protein
MYHASGHTGRKLQAQVYLDSTYYQRLKHMVDNKIHSRAHQPVQTLLTRQPVESRIVLMGVGWIQQLEEFEKPMRKNTLRLKHDSDTYDKL